MGFGLYLTNYLNASFVAQILQTMFCGIYTVLCGYTVWHLLLRKDKRVYTSCLVILWALVTSILFLDWRRSHILTSDFRNVRAMDDYNNFAVYFDPWTTVNNVFSMLVIMIADALLIYRCYAVYGRNKWILIVLGALLAADIVAACIALSPIPRPNVVRDSRAFPFIYFVASLFLSSIVITGVATSLIIWRIHLATRGNSSISSLALYTRIQKILLESGIIYAIGMITTGITMAIIVVNMNRWKYRIVMAQWNYFVVLTYGQALLTPLAGIAPTLIALRVVVQTSQTEDDATGPLTPITFRRSHLRSHIVGIYSKFSFTHSRGDPAVAQPGGAKVSMVEYPARLESLGEQDTV